MGLGLSSLDWVGRSGSIERKTKEKSRLTNGGANTGHRALAKQHYRCLIKKWTWITFCRNAKLVHLARMDYFVMQMLYHTVYLTMVIIKDK